MVRISPVLLAGGSGTRLWPLSRKSYPKQFANLIGEKTLFQQSALRLTTSAQVEFAAHIILTNSDFRFIVTEQLQELGIDPDTILIEPEAKNTAPAILAASLFAKKNDPEAILLAAPSDHVMPDIADFHKAISVGLNQVQNGKIVTFGISPTQPETGYGYLELSQDNLDDEGTSNVVRFVEKPDHLQAVKMLEDGNFLWNAGFFLFKAADMIDQFKSFSPSTLKFVSESVDALSEDLGFFRLNSVAWSKLEDISIDFAIMEKATNLVSVPYSSKWSDLGDWNSVWIESEKDEAGNARSVNAHAIDCSDTLLRSENKEQQLIGLGLENIMAIAMSDAVLVANKDRAQEVKNVVEQLKKQSISQAEIFPKDHRPWGWFERLVFGNRFQVKRICVKPGGVLSLQSHSYRSEHWVVVAGTAKVQINNEINMITEGQSVYVPLGAIHRMENPGKNYMELIEVQIGEYLEEYDIVRYEDIYSS